MADKSTTFQLVVYTGATKRQTFYYRDKATGSAIPLTGYSALMQIREFANDETLILEVSPTTSPSFISIDEPNGALTVEIDETVTEAWREAGYEDLVYAIHLIEPSGDPVMFLMGPLCVVVSATRHAP